MNDDWVRIESNEWCKIWFAIEFAIMNEFFDEVWIDFQNKRGSMNEYYGMNERRKEWIMDWRKW